MKMTHFKSDADRLILFFNGWGMDQDVISHLNRDGYDIIMINDYQALDMIDADFSSYTETYLIAWSMGVWAAAQTTNHLTFDKAIAINGTQDPVDDHQGIPPKIFQGTISNWSERSREKFNMRILGGKAAYQSFGESIKNRNIQEQKEELIAIQNHIENGYTYTRHFDFSIIGEKDAIFASPNQKNAWKSVGKVILDIPHYPFQYFQSWDEIIQINDRQRTHKK